MADKLTTLLLDALGRVALAPAGLPLFGGKTKPGLFPATSVGRQAAQRAQAEEYIRTIANDANTKPERDLAIATAKGLAFLVEQNRPKQVLEDLVRAVEARHEQLDTLIDTARQMHVSLDAIKTVISQVSPQFDRANTASVTWTDTVCEHLARWQESASGDCPLPDLYRSVHEQHPDVTIGAFHDGLRSLHQNERIYLHPWTGPLYALPEPEFAFLIGHEIAYYASGRSIPATSAANGVQHAFA